MNVTVPWHTVAPRPHLLGDFVGVSAAAVQISHNDAGDLVVTFDGTLTAAEQATVTRRVQSFNTAAETLREQAANAMQANRDFVALAAPTNAQTVAQVKALTRQMNALARLTLGQLDDTT